MIILDFLGILATPSGGKTSKLKHASSKPDPRNATLGFETAKPNHRKRQEIEAMAGILGIVFYL